MKKLYLFLFLCLTVILSGVKLHASSDPAMLKENIYTVEKYTLIEYLDIPVLDMKDQIILKNNLVAVVKFAEDSREFLIKIASFESDNFHILPIPYYSESVSKKLKEFLSVMYEQRQFQIKEIPIHFNKDGKTLLSDYQLGETSFKVEEPFFAQAALQYGYVNSMTELYKFSGL